MSKNILSFNKWLNNGKIHSLDNVLKAYQKFSNIKIDYLKDDNLIKQAQDKYAQDIIAQDQKVSEKIKKHFSDNWQHMLVCKNFEAGSVFSTPELSRHIGEYLGWEVFKPLDQVPLTGAIEE